MTRATDLAAVLLLATYSLLAGFLLMLAVPVLGFLWNTRPWLLLILAPVLVGIGVGLVRRAGSAPRAGLNELPPARHPGILIHAIPVAGGLGLAVVLGYVVMFWFGLPGLRPLVLGVGLLGAMLGAGLIWREHRRAP